MSTNHNRIKVADLETNQPNKILKTNQNGELEFSDVNNLQSESYNALDCITEGKVLDARQGKILKDMIDNKESVSLVNDLTTGGTTKALTAEMGKQLNEIKANLESPNFIGMPTAPTAPQDTNTTQIATTEFVRRELNSQSGGIQNLQSVIDNGNETSTDIKILPNANLGVTTIKSTSDFSIRIPDPLVPNNFAETIGGDVPTEHGLDVTAQNFFVLNLANKTRIRQTGKLGSVQFYTKDLPTSSLKFVIWRKTGHIYNKIYSQEMLLFLEPNSGSSILLLPNPIDVLEGDYTGFSFTSDGPQTTFQALAQTGGCAYYTSDPGNSSDFVTGAIQGNFYIPLIGRTNISPIISFIGDSIVEGQPESLSFINDGITNTFTTTFPYKVQTNLNITGQNLGIGGQTSTQIKNRFGNAIREYTKPKYVVINGGINDIAAAVSNSTIISNYTQMLDICILNNIKAFILLVLPYNFSTTLQARQIDDLNNSLISLAVTKNATIIDARSDVGQFRPGGDAGNLWNINPLYLANDGLGMHYKSSGYKLIGNKVSSSVSTIRDSNSYSFLLPVKSPGNYTLATLDDISVTKDALNNRIFWNSNGAPHSSINIGRTGSSTYYISLITGNNNLLLNNTGIDIKSTNNSNTASIKLLGVMPSGNVTYNLPSKNSGSYTLMLKEDFIDQLMTTRTTGTVSIILDGSTSIYSIVHNLGQTPAIAFANIKESNNLENFKISYDSTNIILTYLTPPASETIQINWIALK